ncbi:glycosyltransferase involved in cell wall biosynthesis [Rhodococcus wratislaviensis]|uniref:glycosyltransferase family 4 protein n=1 Tax=Rhodococcus wratislaviensis TaxID=44752 RepID=UPI000E21E6F3|nr:glycosyltransferase family 4 protein [Rhodococcus wratislaviensis]REE73012.1 glycosyltransferase involved in cell wall biosynthesis [Rhodococcus wratislaviensis]
MRISVLGLHYAPEVTGNAPYTSGLAAGLAKRGHDVQVLTGYPHYPSWKVDTRYKGWSSRETLDGVAVRRFRHYVPAAPNSIGRVLLESTYGARLLAARWGRADVVLCVSPALLSSAIAIARNRLTPRRPPVGVLVQDLYSLGIAETKAAGNTASTLATRFESAVLGSADGVSVVHEKFKSNAVRRLAIPEDRISVIRNWMHLRETTKNDRRQTRANRGWADSDTVVLHAGNMGVKQGLENVVAAAKLADSQTSRRVIFVLMGDGNQRRALESAAKGVRSLQFIGSLPDEQFQATLAAADILLVNERPGVSEMSVPSKLTSYFSTGIPVLAASSPEGTTANELTRSGGGIAVTPGDPYQLLDGVALLASDLALSRTLGANGKRYCVQYLSEEYAIDQYESWLQGLVYQSKQGKAVD